MNLVIYIVGEAISLPISIKIRLNLWSQEINNITKKGYRVNRSDILKYFQEKNKPSSKLGLFFNGLSLGLPGINVLVSQINNAINTHNLFNDLKKEHLLIPLSDKDKEMVKKFKNKDDLITFSLLETFNNDEDVSLEVIDDMPIIYINNILRLDYPRLPALSYTLAEIKKLNAVYGLKYAIGKMNDINTAIIGMPDTLADTTKVLLGNQSIDNTQSFVPFLEKDITQERFIVYSYASNYENDPKLQNCLNEIISNRDYQKNTNHLLVNKEIVDSNFQNESNNNYPILKRSIK
jgi:hypothetical protein